MNRLIIEKKDRYASVREYYGRVLQSKKDLKTTACCDGTAVPNHIKKILAQLDEEIIVRSYGCGAPFPTRLEGARVLDLGCGAGRDCFVLSRLVGPKGFVVGVDMTEEQLAVARRHLEPTMKRFGYTRPNVRFIQGHIEALHELDLEPASFDVVVSNCVVNLSPDKKAVLQGVFDLLKEGGEFYFSDVYADRRLPAWASQDAVLLGECLGGALYHRDFIRMARAVGFKDPRVVAAHPIEIADEALQRKIGFCRFQSITHRLFKIHDLEDACEDYGDVVMYRGSVEENPHAFVLDQDHAFERGRCVAVCRNTKLMLHQSRFSVHFKFFEGDGSHFGAFDCLSSGQRSAFSPTAASQTTTGCC